MNSMYGFFFLFWKGVGGLQRVCLCEETAKQEGRDRKKKDGVEGYEREESTPKLVSVCSHREVP